MKINPLNSYDEAKYPSIKDMRSKKISKSAKSGTAILMASLTALAVSNCNPLVFDSDDHKSFDWNHAFGIEKVTKETTISETTEGNEYPVLAGDVEISETYPDGRGEKEDPVTAGILIDPEISVAETDPSLAGSIIYSE